MAAASAAGSRGANLTYGPRRLRILLALDIRAAHVKFAASRQRRSVVLLWKSTALDEAQAPSPRVAGGWCISTEAHISTVVEQDAVHNTRTIAEALAVRLGEEWERPDSELSAWRARIDERRDPGGLGYRVAAQREQAAALHSRRPGDRHALAAGELAQRLQERLDARAGHGGDDDEAGLHFVADLCDGLDGRVRAEVDDPPAA